MLVKQITLDMCLDGIYRVFVDENGDILLKEADTRGTINLNCVRHNDILDTLNELLSFHSPKAWTIAVDLSDTKDFVLTMKKHYKLDDDYAKHHKQIQDASNLLDGIEPEDCCDDAHCLQDVYEPSLRMATNYIKRLYKTSKRQKISLKLKGAECPVLHEALTPENGVILNCDHPISLDAWNKIKPNGPNTIHCPLCRCEHNNKYDVKYHPDFMTCRESF